MSELTWKKMHEAAIDQCTELTAQLEATRKEVVRLRETLNTAKSRFYNLALHNDGMQCGVIPSVGVAEIESALATSTTPDPVWEHNFMVRKMRELPVVAYGDRLGSVWQQAYCIPETGVPPWMASMSKLVAIPDLKEVKSSPESDLDQAQRFR